MNDDRALRDAVAEAAAKWAMADAISQAQPYGTGRNVWRKTADRLAEDIFRAARARHHQAASSSPAGAGHREASASPSAVRPVPPEAGANPAGGNS